MQYCSSTMQYLRPPPQTAKVLTRVGRTHPLLWRRQSVESRLDWGRAGMPACSSRAVGFSKRWEQLGRTGRKCGEAQCKSTQRRCSSNCVPGRVVAARSCDYTLIGGHYLLMAQSFGFTRANWSWIWLTHKTVDDTHCTLQTVEMVHFPVETGTNVCPHRISSVPPKSGWENKWLDGGYWQEHGGRAAHRKTGKSHSSPSLRRPPQHPPR